MAALIVHAVGAGTSPAVAAALPGAEPATVWWIQLVGTAVLLATVFGLICPTSPAAPPFLQPALIGIAAAVIGMGGGPSAGLNPATDLGPRIVAGFASPVNLAYWWVPVLAPVAGGLLGGALYRLSSRLPAQVTPSRSAAAPIQHSPTTTPQLAPGLRAAPQPSPGWVPPQWAPPTPTRRGPGSRPDAFQTGPRPGREPAPSSDSQPTRRHEGRPGFEKVSR